MAVHMYTILLELFPVMSQQLLDVLKNLRVVFVDLLEGK